MTGANSAVGLRSMSARFLFLDEVDAYPGDVEGEGDPVALAEARARTFGWRRKTLLVSTPTISGLSRIEREYLASDQRRFFVPCPHCGAMQWLRFERLVWDKGEPETRRAISARPATAPSASSTRPPCWPPANGAPPPSPQDPHAIGFHISALYSPVGWFAWSQSGAGLGGGPGRRPGDQDLQEHRAGRDLAGERRGAGLAAAVRPARGMGAGTVPPGGCCSPPASTSSATGWRPASGPGARIGSPGWSSTACWRAIPFEAAVWEELRRLLGESWRHASRRIGSAWPWRRSTAATA